MNRWAEFYCRVFGFHRFISFDDKDISTEYSALMSIVMSDDSHSVKFPINEPAPGRRKSQIDEYLEAYRGAGRAAHCVAGRSDVIATVGKLAAQRRASFCACRTSYYDVLPRARRRDRGDRSRRFARLGILVDRDEEGYLLQIFTRRWRTVRRCSSRSSSAREAAASAKETSRRCSKPSNWSRRGAAICRHPVARSIDRMSNDH